MARVNRAEVWIGLRERDEVRAEAEVAEGPLAGLLLAVKNNVDVAGLPTTAACPTFATGPAEADAVAVARLRSAGATVIGTTNLDQFATGLVGQRSPYGGVRDARRPAYVSGGSSSGSAVAVALGLADLAIGTDTAGSGRVPAAYQGIVGIKPTLGVVSTEGVVPACRSWDAVTIMARDLATAGAAMGVMAGGPGTRAWPADAPVGAPARPRLAVPDELVAMAPGWAEAFGAAVDQARTAGCAIVPIPFGSFLEAARLLYDGGLVAERHAAVGDFVDTHREDVDPTVGAIIARAGDVRASDMLRDRERLDALKRESLALLTDCDALLVPTAPGQPTRADVAADPVGVNSWVGTYTNFCNLFDLCAVAVPAGEVADQGDGVAQFGVTLLAPAFGDAVVADVAARVRGLGSEGPSDRGTPGDGAVVPPLPWPAAAGLATTELFVVGAHLVGQPLERELRDRGALWCGPARTAAAYALKALDTTPPKPGLVRVGAGGAAIRGEVWRLSVGALGDFLAALPSPMNLGAVDLEDGREVLGFGCDAQSAAGGADITRHGGWKAYLAAR
ncbi:UNVERIFIED_CONTAM: allophanate hydrolase [Mumia flava]